MNGADYVANELLYTKLPDGSFVVAAAPGQPCDRVTPTSLPWLLEQGRIRPRSTTPPAPPVSAPVPDEDGFPLEDDEA